MEVFSVRVSTQETPITEEGKGPRSDRRAVYRTGKLSWERGVSHLTHDRVPPPNERTSPSKSRPGLPTYRSVEGLTNPYPTESTPLSEEKISLSLTVMTVQVFPLRQVLTYRVFEARLIDDQRLETPESGPQTGTRLFPPLFSLLYLFLVTRRVRGTGAVYWKIKCLSQNTVKRNYESRPGSTVRRPCKGRRVFCFVCT